MDADTRAALFRVYRSLPLEQVLEKLGAEALGEQRWRTRGGATIEISGQAGWQGWKNIETQENQKGAIDLVVHAMKLKGSGQALGWLRRAFPEAEAQVEAEKARAAAKAAERAAAPVSDGAASSGAGVGGGVRRAPSARQPGRRTREQLNALFDRYKGVRLSEVLARLGADPNQDGDKSKWKIPGLGNIITKGQMWKNVQTEVDKGFGGVDIVAHALFSTLERGPARMKALDWMMKEFGEEFGDDLLAEDMDTGPKDFSPPERFPGIADRVADYLVEERGLPSSLVAEVIKNGTVYGSHPWSEERREYFTRITRCVFLGPASAELRDTTPDGFKGCCDGSQTDSSGFSVRPADQVPEYLVGLTEAAIDGLSYRALFPGRFAMSTNGAGRFLLQFRTAREAVERGLGVRLALDADPAGDLAAQKVFNAFYVRKALGHHLGVPEEKVDEWLTEGDVIIDVDKSAHHLFFNHGWAPELRVSRGDLVQGEKGLEKAWTPTDEMAKPSIRLNVRKDVHPKLLRGEMTLTVGQAGFEYVTKTLNVRRDRPVLAKDWNEVLKRLGAGYGQDYDDKARQGFARGVPALPPELEAFRRAPEETARPSDPRPNPPSAERGGVEPPQARGRPAALRR